MENNCIVDISIACVESSFKSWYDSYSCYMHIDHGLMDIGYPSYIFLGLLRCITQTM
jgi:hypothetical protein